MTLNLNPATTALIIQGTQRDLLHPDGILSSPEIREHVAAQNMVANLTRLATAARQNGAAVIHVLFVLEPDGRGTKVNAPLFRSVVAAGGIRRGSWGVEPIDELASQPGDFVIEKARENPFFNTTLESVLRGLDVETVVLAGGLTSGGIESAARHAADAGYRVLIATDAIAGQNAELHRNSLSGFLTAVAEFVTADEVSIALKIQG